MAARPAKAAASGAPALNPPAGVERLPDDLLIKVLGSLDVRERRVLPAEARRLPAACLPPLPTRCPAASCFCRCLAALVSRRWYSCAYSPELCSKLHFVPEDADEEQVAWFLAWLRRHGQHLRHLSLTVCPRSSEPDFNTPEEVHDMVHSWMSTAVSVARQLEQLMLVWHLPAPLAADADWVSQLPPTLRELGLLSRSELCLAGSLGSLTQLTKLLLLGGQDGIDFEDDVSLPPSVRLLALGEKRYEELPPQLLELTNLESLVLDSGAWLAEGYDMCTQLSSLRSLQLNCVAALPSCLSSLTGLERLAVLHNDRKGIASLRGVESGLVAALQHLTGLTSLYLKGCLGGGSSAAVLAGLSRLQQLCFYPGHGASEPLPCGPWSSSLQVLDGKVECFEKSIPLLESCTALRHVFARANSSSNTPKFWRWVRLHAPLQVLDIQYTKLRAEDSDFALAMSQMAEVWHARRDLRYGEILSSPPGQFNQYEKLFLWCDDTWESVHNRFPTILINGVRYAV